MGDVGGGLEEGFNVWKRIVTGLGLVWSGGEGDFWEWDGYGAEFGVVVCGAVCCCGGFFAMEE